MNPFIKTITLYIMLNYFASKNNIKNVKSLDFIDQNRPCYRY